MYRIFILETFLGMKLILDSKKNIFSCFFSWVSFAHFSNCAFIHLFIFVIYKNVFIILIVTPGYMGNGLGNFQNMVIPL